MPVHDWTQVDAGLFHDFHQRWSVAITNALNAGILPKGYYALVEQRTGGPEPDVIAVESSRGRKAKTDRTGTLALAAQPRTRVVYSLEPEAEAYARKANRITVRHPLGEVVAVIEIVSPGNKGSRNAVRAFVQKAVEFLYAGVHLLLIDLFPPTRRDPEGLPKAIADEFEDKPFDRPAGQPLTLAGFDAGPPRTVYVETVAVGDPLPAMPVFVAPGLHVPIPLEPTYAATWEATPDPIRELVAPAPRRRK
ncbi:MAG TPA: DUF4058 family protein [Gemmataceae bacterium]|nr:DUF4058 family protein [Gemmataceae bacterium]